MSTPIGGQVAAVDRGILHEPVAAQIAAPLTGDQVDELDVELGAWVRGQPFNERDAARVAKANIIAALVNDPGLKALQIVFPGDETKLKALLAQQPYAITATVVRELAPPAYGASLARADLPPPEYPKDDAGNAPLANDEALPPPDGAPPAWAVQAGNSPRFPVREAVQISEAVRISRPQPEPSGGGKYRPLALEHTGRLIVEAFKAGDASAINRCADHFFSMAKPGNFPADRLTSDTIRMVDDLIDAFSQQRGIASIHAVLRVVETSAGLIRDVQARGGATREGAAIQLKIAGFVKDVRDGEAAKIQAEIAATKRLRAERRLDELERFRGLLSPKLQQFQRGDIGSRSFVGGALRTPLEVEMTSLLESIASLPSSPEKEAVLNEVVRTLNTIPAANPRDAKRFADTMLTKVLPRLRADRG